MSYDDDLQNINEHFSGQKDWWSKKQCNTCKKNPDWYYCGGYLGAINVNTGEHYEDIFEKINDIISELPNNTSFQHVIRVDGTIVSTLNLDANEDEVININLFN